MPRTKISKSSKRNREASQREEKVREFEASLDEFLISHDKMGQQLLWKVETQVSMLIPRINKKLLQMKFRDFLDLNLDKFADWTPMLSAQNSSSSSAYRTNSTINNTMRTAKISNPNDEGYLTEDSTGGSGTAGSLAVLTSMTQLHLPQQQQQQRGRTPGPLNSARARRPRRSKSFCGDFIPSAQKKPPPPQSALASDHASRNKMRTPLASRSKALSADRTSKICAASPKSPATAFMRWPKPGELVMSMCGSPVIAQVLPDRYANVNIPIKNGVLSLRPKKLSELEPEYIEAIDPDILNQIKTLHANLNLIVNMADKATLN